MVWPTPAGSVAQADAAVIPPVPSQPLLSSYTPSAWKHSLTMTVERHRWIQDKIIITAESNISPDKGLIDYYWFLDGQFVSKTKRPVFEFLQFDNEPLRVDVLDSTDEGFDPNAYKPQGLASSRYTVYWNPSEEVTSYFRIRMKKSGGSWEIIGKADYEIGQWNYWAVTPVLDDQGEYEFDVAAMDEYDNPGATVLTDSIKVIRIPDIEAYMILYSGITNKVTYSASP